MPPQLFAALLIMIVAGGIGFVWLVWSFTGVSSLWGVLVFTVFAVGSYAVYALFFVDALSKTFATMEGNLLFVRRGDEAHDQVQVGVIDLAEPFAARCTSCSTTVAEYRVKQNRQVVNFVVPMTSDGRVVREGLKLPWPPKLTS
jgi:hypothetical protein